MRLKDMKNYLPRCHLNPQVKLAGKKFKTELILYTFTNVIMYLYICSELHCIYICLYFLTKNETMTAHDLKPVNGWMFA